MKTFSFPMTKPRQQVIAPVVQTLREAGRKPLGTRGRPKKLRIRRLNKEASAWGLQQVGQMREAYGQESGLTAGSCVLRGSR